MFHNLQSSQYKLLFCFLSKIIIVLQKSSTYWVIQNDCGWMWQLRTKMYVATLWVGQS
jgi:hypothetical protein